MAKEKKNPQYTCPFCFSHVDMNAIHYKCTGDACAELFVRGLSDKEKKKFSGKRPNEEIDREKSVFLGRDPDGPNPVTSNKHFIRNNSGICDVCKKPVYDRVCPVCHNSLPPGAEEGNTIFVILGPKGVGKSHYIAVLINELKNSFSSEFGASMSTANDDSMIKYREIYYKRLYEESRKLSPTPSLEGKDSSLEPMIYYLRFLNGKEPKVFTLVFMDTAGEDLCLAEDISRLNMSSFIANASGIVFLVDPLQIPAINSRIHVENKPKVGPDVADMLSNISKIIRNTNRLRQGKLIPIPLAVALTKSDVLLKVPEDEEERKVLLGLNSSIHIERERGKYDSTNMEQISVEIEEYLRRNVSDAFIKNVGDFSTHAYFAVSALGSNPTGEKLTRGVSPLRVEDPFIWLLNNESTDGENR